MVRELRSIFLIAFVTFTLATSGTCFAGFDVLSVGGDNTTGSIQSAVDQFRNTLGNPNNGNSPGPLDSGRREINWDGGGATTASPGGTPFTVFFNSRGAGITTPGTGFLQTPINDPLLTGINTTYATTFSTFSPVRIFTPVGSNITDVTFIVPGTSPSNSFGTGTPATVSGFGAVFTDVDLADTSKLEFFNINNSLLFSQSVTPGTVSDGSLSFLGATANAGEAISLVRITAGTTALGPNDDPAGGVDVAALDDFFYSEPRAVPEPSALIMGGMAALVGLGYSWRRRRVTV